MRAGLVVLAVGLLAAPATAQDGDAASGERLFRQCRACHQVGEGAANRVGPHLNALIGRPAGSVEGFRYSDAMTGAGADGLTWTEAALDAYLADPVATVPGTWMTYRGMSDPQDRADTIAYLATFSAGAPMGAAQGFTVAPEILAIAGDPAYGEYLASECAACHGGADAGIPSISGRETADFVTALQAYKQGARAHPVMTMVAERLSDEEIASLAVYYQAAD